MIGPEQTVCVTGATGTIGRAVVAELARRGVSIVALTRRDADIDGARVVAVDFADANAMAREMAQSKVDAVISCMASRTGVPDDAEAVDHRANLAVLDAAQAAGVGHFVLLSAICVQKPKLAFQRAKLKFEAALIGSGTTYSIVRPTAFFKSLSGQVERVRRGKPFLIFGDGRQTACKPISDGDLASYLVDCLDDPARRNAVLPIGGPGPAVTPREQGDMLFAMLGRAPRFRSVPVGMLRAIAGVLGALGFTTKAELARIGHYYATESMLVWDSERVRYDADATPSTGRATLADHYRALIDGAVADDRGDHAVF